MSVNVCLLGKRTVFIIVFIDAVVGAIVPIIEGRPCMFVVFVSLISITRANKNG